MLKNILGFDSEVFKHGTAINIDDSHIEEVFHSRSPRAVYPDKFNVNLSGNYLIKSCYVTKLVVIDPTGKEWSIPIEFVNDENPRFKISLLAKG